MPQDREPSAGFGFSIDLRACSSHLRPMMAKHTPFEVDGPKQSETVVKHQERLVVR